MSNEGSSNSINRIKFSFRDFFNGSNRKSTDKLPAITVAQSYEEVDTVGKHITRPKFVKQYEKK